MDTMTVQPKEQKKGLKKGAKIAIIVFSVLFFLAAAIVPIVLFVVNKTDNKVEDKEVGNFLMRYVIDDDGEHYEIIRYIGTEGGIVTIDAEIKDPDTGRMVKVTKIIPNAFDATSNEPCKDITGIVIGTVEDANGQEVSYLSSIGENAFYGCTLLGLGTADEDNNLATFVIPAGVQSIGANAFANTAVQQLVIADASTLKLEDNALSGAKKLTTVDIAGASGNSVSGDLNLGSDTIENIEISGNNVNIGAGTLNGLSKLTTLSVYNYANLVIAGENFDTTSQITTLNIYHAEDDLTADFMSKFSLIGQELVTINIAAGINNIQANALSYFSNLRNVSIASGTIVDLGVLGTKTYRDQLFYLYNAADDNFKVDTEAPDAYSLTFANATNVSALGNSFLSSTSNSVIAFA